MDEGDRIRLSGEGEAGVNGGPPGDLYVVIRLQASTRCSSARTTTCIARCRSASASPRSGGEIEIPTLDGSAKIRIPAETQSGKVFRLRGKGIKGVRSHAHGDLLCHVVVETPVNLTPRQKELLQELEAINQEDAGRHDPRAKSWMEGEGVLPGVRRESRGASRSLSS